VHTFESVLHRLVLLIERYEEMSRTTLCKVWSMAIGIRVWSVFELSIDIGRSGHLFCGSWCWRAQR
jgi:hypothetical protein